MKLLLVSADRTTDSGVPTNLGDALLTDALAAGVRSRGHDVSVADFGALRTVGIEAREKLTGPWGLIREIRNADAVIVGGGTLLQDDQPSELFGGLPRLILFVSLIGWISRTPVVYFGVGCDPIARWTMRCLVRLAVKGRRVWARDLESVQRCADLLKIKVELAADVSLLFADRLGDLIASSNVAQSNQLVLALTALDAQTLTSHAVARFKSEFDTIVFVPMHEGEDRGDSESLLEEVGSQIEVLRGLTWEDTVTVFGRSKMVIASRMHAMYISAMVGVPVAALGSSPKIDAFISEFGISRIEGIDGWSAITPLADSVSVAMARARVEAQLDSALRHLGSVL